MDSPVVQVLKSAMQLGAPDPVLSAHVKKSHLEAGKALVDRLESARVAQSERHAELMRLAAQTKKRCDVLETRRMSDWKALDEGMDEAVSLLQELRLPDLELALTSLERVQLQEQERVWRENTANCIEKETEQIKAKLDQRYRDALQAAFDEQMKRFKESGVAPVPLPKPQKTIEEVSILPDENEKEEMEKFLGEDEDPGRPGGDEDE